MNYNADLKERNIMLLKIAAVATLGLFMCVGCAGNEAWQNRMRAEPYPTPGPTATEEGYRAMLDTWVSGSELTLVREWGVPFTVYTAGEHKFLVYKNHVLHYNPDGYNDQDVPKVDYHISCTTTFEIAGGKVLNYQYKGSACQALALPVTANPVSSSAKP
jgi:hypothetical protein